MIRPIWLIAPALTAIGAILGAYQASQDIEPATYVGLTEAWPRLSSEVRAQVRDAAADGKLSNWEYRGLNDSIMNSAGFMSWSMAENSQSVDKARANFMAVVKQEP